MFVAGLIQNGSGREARLPDDPGAQARRLRGPLRRGHHWDRQDGRLAGDLAVIDLCTFRPSFCYEINYIFFPICFHLYFDSFFSENLTMPKKAFSSKKKKAQHQAERNRGSCHLSSWCIRICSNYFQASEKSNSLKLRQPDLLKIYHKEFNYFITS